MVEKLICRYYLIWGGGKLNNNKKVKDVATPTENNDATNKKYVDDKHNELKNEIEKLKEKQSANLNSNNFNTSDLENNVNYWWYKVNQQIIDLDDYINLELEDSIKQRLFYYNEINDFINNKEQYKINTAENIEKLKVYFYNFETLLNNSKSLFNLSLINNKTIKDNIVDIVNEIKSNFTTNYNSKIRSLIHTPTLKINSINFEKKITTDTSFISVILHWLLNKQFIILSNSNIDTNINEKDDYDYRLKDNADRDKILYKWDALMIMKEQFNNKWFNELQNNNFKEQIKLKITEFENNVSFSSNTHNLSESQISQFNNWFDNELNDFRFTFEQLFYYRNSIIKEITLIEENFYNRILEIFDNNSLFYVDNELKIYEKFGKFYIKFKKYIVENNLYINQNNISTNDLLIHKQNIKSIYYETLNSINNEINNITSIETNNIANQNWYNIFVKTLNSNEFNTIKQKINNNYNNINNLSVEEIKSILWEFFVSKTPNTTLFNLKGDNNGNLKKGWFITIRSIRYYSYIDRTDQDKQLKVNNKIWFDSLEESIWFKTYNKSEFLNIHNITLDKSKNPFIYQLGQEDWTWLYNTINDEVLNIKKKHWNKILDTNEYINEIYNVIIKISRDEIYKYFNNRPELLRDNFTLNENAIRFKEFYNRINNLSQNEIVELRLLSILYIDHLIKTNQFRYF